jgi:hypothetical protein
MEYRYKYKYKYGNPWLNMEDSTGLLANVIRVKNSVSPYTHGGLPPTIVRARIGYLLDGIRQNHRETSGPNPPVIERRQERTYLIPFEASHVDLEIEFMSPIPSWQRLCFNPNVPLPICVEIKSKLITLAPTCVNC